MRGDRHRAGWLRQPADGATSPARSGRFPRHQDQAVPGEGKAKASVRAGTGFAADHDESAGDDASCGSWRHFLGGRWQSCPGCRPAGPVGQNVRPAPPCLSGDTRPFYPSSLSVRLRARPFPSRLRADSRRENSGCRGTELHSHPSPQCGNTKPAQEQLAVGRNSGSLVVAPRKYHTADIGESRRLSIEIAG